MFDLSHDKKIRVEPLTGSVGVERFGRWRSEKPPPSRSLQRRPRHRRRRSR
jgi:hypothetical protein